MGLGFYVDFVVVMWCFEFCCVILDDVCGLCW